MAEHHQEVSAKQRGAAKVLLRIPVEDISNKSILRKPPWIRTRIPSGSGAARIADIHDIVEKYHLHTVCREASCPNLPECFSQGTATFMIMGDKCTRRCSFCDVAHGRPDPLDHDEPFNLACAIAQMKLRYVVITSVDRDDLKDGGASHFSACLTAIRAQNTGIKIEVLVPDFRGRMEAALAAIAKAPPDVFNHNLETVPRLYKQARPGSDYAWSLNLLKTFKQQFAHIPTKSGLMLGLGETYDEVIEVMKEMRAHHIDGLTLGQYLAPSRHHIPVARYVSPEEFSSLGQFARTLGFSQVASGPLVRSSYHAEQQAAGEVVS